MIKIIYNIFYIVLTFFMLFALGHTCRTEFQQLVVILLFTNIFLTLIISQNLNDKEKWKKHYI